MSAVRRDQIREMLADLKLPEAPKPWMISWQKSIAAR
jgi:hypothetical protein